MDQREKYISFELSGDSLDKFINDLSDKILAEFWPTIPDGDDLKVIKERLEKSILAAME